LGSAYFSLGYTEWSMDRISWDLSVAIWQGDHSKARYPAAKEDELNRDMHEKKPNGWQ